MSWVEQYMRKMKLDVETRLKVRRYLEYTLGEVTYRKNDENKLLALLSQNLKDDVITKINRSVLLECERLERFLKDKLSEPIVYEMLYHFKERTYSPNELIHLV